MTTHTRIVACCAVMLVGGAAPLELRASDDVAVPMVVHASHWEPPAVSEAEFLATRILEREGGPWGVTDEARRELAEEIDGVLSRIRDRYPEMANVVARETYADTRSLILDVEPSLLDTVLDLVGTSSTPVPLRTGNEAFDIANGTLGLRAVEVFPPLESVVCHFDQPFALSLAYLLYLVTDGVRSFGPNSYVGDGPDLDMARSQVTWSVVFRKAWGDCPAGCIYREFFFFSVTGNEIERIDDVRAMESSEFVEMAERRGWRLSSATSPQDSN